MAVTVAHHIKLLNELIATFDVASKVIFIGEHKNDEEKKDTVNMKEKKVNVAEMVNDGRDIIELEKNCILLRNAFDIEEQCELYSAIIGISALTLKGNIKSNKNWTRLMQIKPSDKRHKGRLSPIYDRLFNRTFNILSTMDICTELPSLSSIGKHAMRANLYKAPHGNIYRHYDKRKGWVMLYSLGCSVIFHVKGPKMDSNGIQFNMNSGDILLFNSSVNAKIEHGVDKVIDGSCPLQLLNKIKKHPKFNLNNVRISVQTRFHVN